MRSMRIDLEKNLGAEIEEKPSIWRVYPEFQALDTKSKDTKLS